MENKITKDEFIKKYHEFREIMCSKVEKEEKLKAFEYLLYVYLKVREEDFEFCKMAMQSLNIELGMRLGLEAVAELDKLL